ncbi:MULTISPECIES: hypothetical protein [unclassified Pyramidobacter]|uniref:hypothetical protein n=1 Tax=unclassified Pyramidobacter TaxID=2632171 RepID=UPI001315215E|nr:hypothetical protein [Pyramidobacter sp. CG50-2]
MQKVLQKGYDDLRELYRGRENTAEAEIWRKKNARSGGDGAVVVPHGRSAA